MTGHSLGGEEQGKERPGVGSSPTVPNKKKLRRIIADCDRKLSSCFWPWDVDKKWGKPGEIDAKRKAARLKLKEYRD